MNKVIKIGLLSFALAGTSLAAGLPAKADNVTVAVNPGGGIAFGYSDGYWDRGHQWHAWQDSNEASRWRAENRDHYYDYHHDRDPGAGWRANDTWWDRH